MIISKKILFIIGALYTMLMLPGCVEKQREIKREDDPRERDYKKQNIGINRLDDRVSQANLK